jgi:hypothetical protein
MHPHAATQPIASDHTSLQRWAPEPPHVPQPRTSPPCCGELWCCHVAHGPRPHLLAELSSGAATRSSALDLASLPRWALVLPCAPQLWTSPTCRGGLWRCHVALASPPREESSGATMYSMAPSGLWTTGIKKGLAALGTQLGSHVS